mmetsp:Transcript_1525/g.5235  ORF Transcript_1525/g.5235 Transcript_1525/m.5235 type:complete len:202 (+) Transcript_1525:340-945(+)
MNGEASQAAPPPPREAGVSFPAPPAVPVHPSLEARLAESEARRDAAELRAERAEEEVAKLRQHLVTFSEKMAAAARESAMDDVPGQRPTMSDAPPPPPPPAAENPPSALATPVAIAPTPTAASTPLGPPASSDLGDDGTNSPDGRSNKRPRRVRPPPLSLQSSKQSADDLCSRSGPSIPSGRPDDPGSSTTSPRTYSSFRL